MKIILGAKERIYSAKQNPSVALAKEGFEFLKIIRILFYSLLFGKMNSSFI